MTRTELDKLDALIAEEHNAVYLGSYTDDESGGTVRVYQDDATQQRLLVEIDNDQWAMFTHHESGGAT